MPPFLRVLAGDLVTLTLGLVLPPVCSLTSLATVVDLAAASTGTALIAPANFTLLAHFTELDGNTETHQLTVSQGLSLKFRFGNCPRFQRSTPRMQIF